MGCSHCTVSRTKYDLVRSREVTVWAGKGVGLVKRNKASGAACPCMLLRALLPVCVLLE